MPTVNLGTITTNNGRTRSTGGASGIDVEGIVKSLVGVKEAEKTKVTDKIDVNDKKLSAISEYRTLLAKVQTASDFLKNPAGVNNSAKNIFDYRSVAASSSDGNQAGNYLGVSVSAGATLGSYTIDINKLAVAKSNSSQAYTSKNTALATVGGAGGTPKAGTFTLNGESITIAVGDTLENIVAKINGTTANSDVRADIIKVGDNDFRLKISALKTGIANAYTVGGDATVFNSMFTGGASSAVAADDSEFVIDGSLTITRSTNAISDAVEGVTFTLNQLTPSNTVRVDVSSDSTAVQSKIEELIQTYNDVKTFIAKQQERDDDGKLVKTAILGENDVLNNFVNSVISEFSANVGGITGDINSLSDIGITLFDYAGDAENPAVDSLLQIDVSTLQSKLDSNFTDIRDLFEFQLNSTAPDRVSVFSRNNTISLNAFTIDVDFNRAAGSQVKLNYTDATGTAKSVNAVYDFADQETASSNAISATAPIFGATTTGGTFTSLVNGDQFRVTLNKADGTSTNFDFVYQASPVAANEFNDMTDLAAALEAVAGIGASISSNKLNITPDAQFDTLTFTNLTATDFKGTFGFQDTERPSGTIKGAAGGEFEGLTLVYAGAGATDSVDVTFTQGIADRVNNLLLSYVQEDTGFLDLEVNTITDDSDDLQTEADDLEEKITAYRDKLYNEYAGLESALTQINSILQLLDSQDAARNNNNN